MFAIIDNPASGKGDKAALIEKIQAVLAQRGFSVRMFDTECYGDGARQARLALEAGYRNIVCIGGDGTLSEVISVLAGSDAVLYIVPCGTGNDFARAYGLTGDPYSAFIAQLDGEPVKIDLGSVNGKPFINVSGTGFDVEVLRKTEELKAIYPGSKAYTKAVLSVISKYKARELEISIDGAEPVKRRVTIFEVANGRYFGGGMQVAPKAEYNDGLFDVILVKPVFSFLIPLLLPLFTLGIHIYLPIASMVKAKCVTISSCDKDGMVINIDGQLEDMQTARYEILPAALHVMRPKK